MVNSYVKKDIPMSVDAISSSGDDVYVPEVKQTYIFPYKELFTYFFVSGHVALAIHAGFKKKKIYPIVPQPIQPPRPPPPEPQVITTPLPTDPYALLFNPEQCAIIPPLFTRVAYGDWWELMWHYSELSALGNRIESAHPYVLLATIHKDARCRAGMRLIYHHPLKWREFREGLNTGLQRDRATLEQYLPGFARDLNLNVDTLRPHVLNPDGTNLFKFMYIDV